MIIKLLPGDTQSLAGEEPPLAGIVRCTQGDDREHPGDSDTLLHGLQTGSGVSFECIIRDVTCGVTERISRTTCTGGDIASGWRTWVRPRCS